MKSPPRKLTEYTCEGIDEIKWFTCELSFDEYKSSQMPTSIYDEWHRSLWLKDPSMLPAFPFGESEVPKANIGN